MSALGDLSAVVLGPLQDRADADWQRAPAGKWTPAQIVEHLAIGLESSAERFLERRTRAPMVRRRRTVLEWLARLVIFGSGRFPPGLTAPKGATPAPRVERAATEAKFRRGLVLWEQVERELVPARAQDLFVKHPRLGDLTIGEWLRFHAIHARHHAKQIRRRVAG
jgi:DinB family protein